MSASKGKLTPPKPMAGGALSAATPAAVTPTPGAAPMPVKKPKKSLKPKMPKPPVASPMAKKPKKMPKSFGTKQQIVDASSGMI